MSTYELVFEEPPAPKRGPKSGGAPRRHGRARPVSTYVAPESRRAHGTYVKYVVEKCRCRPCRDANRAYERKRTRAMSRPDEAWVPYVSAARARRHVEELAAAGVGIKTISALSGVPHGSLSKLVYGDRQRRMAPSKRIRPATEAKILAVTLDQVDGAQKIPAGPTWELLEDLLAQGFYKAWISAQLGQRGRALQIRRDLVRASTARKVEALHAEWSGKTPARKGSRWAVTS